MPSGNFAIDPAIKIMLEQNLDEALVDVTNENVRIDVLPAEDGEELIDEILEKTDREDLEELEDSVGEFDSEVRLQVLTNKETLDRISIELSTIKTRLYDADGIKGHITRTEEQFRDIKSDINKGFSDQCKMIESLDSTIQFALGEQNKKIEDNSARINEIEDRVLTIETERDAESKGKNNRIQWYHVAIGISGVLVALMGVALAVVAL